MPQEQLRRAGWPQERTGLCSKCNGKIQKGFKQGSELCLFLKILLWLLSRDEIDKGGAEARRPAEDLLRQSRPERNVFACTNTVTHVLC